MWWVDVPLGEGPFVKAQIPVGYFTTPAPGGHSWLHSSQIDAWYASTEPPPLNIEQWKRGAKRLAQILTGLNDLSGELPPLP